MPKVLHVPLSLQILPLTEGQRDLNNPLYKTKRENDRMPDMKPILNAKQMKRDTRIKTKLL